MWIMESNVSIELLIYSQRLELFGCNFMSTKFSLYTAQYVECLLFSGLILTGNDQTQYE